RPVLGWFLGLRPRRSAATSSRRRCKCWRIRATAWYTGLATIPAVLVVLVPNPTNSRDMVAFLFYAPGFTGLRGFRNTPVNRVKLELGESPAGRPSRLGDWSCF